MRPVYKLALAICLAVLVWSAARPAFGSAPSRDAHAARTTSALRERADLGEARHPSTAVGLRSATPRARSLSASDVREALALACVTYGHCAWLRRVAWCESRFDPRARNQSGATGLFQFMPATFRATPYGAADIYSPYAQALAAGWLVERGRAYLWECR